MESPGTLSYSTSYAKFNNALNAGLLNPMSPPPVLDKTRSSPTLFEIMTNEQDRLPKPHGPTSSPALVVKKPFPSARDRQAQLDDRFAELLATCSPTSRFNHAASCDVKLILRSEDGLSINVNLHRHVLAGNSRFFAAKLSDRASKQQKPILLEISDCEDVEIYLQTLRLMYCKDIRRKLMREEVSRVLAILKVASAIVFEAGILSCLEYLEAAPWGEDDEEKVASVLSQLQLEGEGASEVLKRVSVETASTSQEGSKEDVVLHLLQVVLEGKDEKARREMKCLISKMLRENASRNDLSKESLYSACNRCLELLHSHLLKASEGTKSSDLEQISRQADNLDWILDILIDRQMGDDFADTWAGQSEIAAAHSKVPTVHRFEISRVTARLFVGIGRGQILADKQVRSELLRTWLQPFYEDFGWMRRACRGLDRNMVEEGLSSTILTLPLPSQQEVLMAWFDRFLNSGDDCPNLQKAFEGWWRRRFWRRKDDADRLPQMSMVAAACENP